MILENVFIMIELNKYFYILIIIIVKIKNPTYFIQYPNKTV